ncbi:hypothetical protein ABT269_31845 [Streptomyces viridosporus]|uniref:hypothetical protein n=1 Tax=Streptomyces viridosporus TaxID=67581 RepID=UPI00331D7022
MAHPDPLGEADHGGDPKEKIDADTPEQETRRIELAQALAAAGLAVEHKECVRIRSEKGTRWGGRLLKAA